MEPGWWGAEDIVKYKKKFNHFLQNCHRENVRKLSQWARKNNFLGFIMNKTSNYPAINPMKTPQILLVQHYGIKNSPSLCVNDFTIYKELYIFTKTLEIKNCYFKYNTENNYIKSYSESVDQFLRTKIHINQI